MSDVESPDSLISTVNVSESISKIIISRKATIVELQTVLSVRDMIDLIEIMAVENHNESAWRRYLEHQQ